MPDGSEQEIAEQPQEEQDPIDLSVEAREQVARALAPGEEIQVAAEADMALPGVFTPTWLVLTDVPSQIEIDRELSTYEAYVWALEVQHDHEQALVLSGEVR